MAFVCLVVYGHQKLLSPPDSSCRETVSDDLLNMKPNSEIEKWNLLLSSFMKAFSGSVTCLGCWGKFTSSMNIFHNLGSCDL